jgi:tetratricopeptide (TPR) repeat protein
MARYPTQFSQHFSHIALQTAEELLMKHVTSIKKIIESGDREEAQQAIDNLLELGPNNLEALKLKAMLYSSEGRFSEEAQVWHRVLQVWWPPILSVSKTIISRIDLWLVWLLNVFCDLTSVKHLPYTRYHAGVVRYVCTLSPFTVGRDYVWLGTFAQISHRLSYGFNCRDTL